MKRFQGLLAVAITVLLLLLASSAMLAQPTIPLATPTATQVNVPTFTDGRINPQPFAPVVLFCSSPAGGRFNGAQQVSGFPVVTSANATPTATLQTPNENTVLTVYILNAAGQGTLAWEFDFATGRLLLPSAAQDETDSQTGQVGQNNQSVIPTGTQTPSGSGNSATSTPSGSSTTVTPTQSAALPGNTTFGRQSSVIAQAATSTPTGSATAVATQGSVATVTPGTSTINLTPIATVTGNQSGQNANRSITLASGAGVTLSVSNGRYIISAPQLDGKLYQFVFDGCPGVGDFDVLVNGVPTE
ncbi:MAG: hypothetical protein SF123_02260 [Chloroflexota bacterium]|nr:hypothetical protein [Chloroflexota bacterium]